MIAGLLGRLALGRILSKVPWQVWLVLGLVVAAALSAWYIDNRAYRRGFAEADAQWAERVRVEVDRQTQANREALRAAEAEIERLNQERIERDARIQDLIEQARQDPSADRPALSVDGVRRLNSVD